MYTLDDTYFVHVSEVWLTCTHVHIQGNNRDMYKYIGIALLMRLRMCCWDTQQITIILLYLIAANFRFPRSNLENLVRKIFRLIIYIRHDIYGICKIVSA